MTRKLTQDATISLILALFLISAINQTTAQVTVDTSRLVKRTFGCPTSQSFSDDGLSSGLYIDNSSRADTVVLCPSSDRFKIRVTFSSFDVASGDFLNVYDCDLTETSCALDQSASGSGASRAFGGWVQANCDPSFNASGCLSFVFETNGDNNKGNGWQANITCEDAAVDVTCPGLQSMSIDCNISGSTVSFPIVGPTFSACGGSAAGRVNITTNSNIAGFPLNNVVANGTILGNFQVPIGTHLFTATSVVDNTKSCTFTVAVDQPGMTCNNIVTSAIGFGCSARIGVDDILEGPCVGAGTTYTLEVDLNAKGGIARTTIDGTSLNTLAAGALEIPSTDFDCGAEYTVTVTRNVNGAQRSCTGRVRFVDNSAPTISFSASTIRTCGEISDEDLKKQLNITVFDNCDVRDTLVSIGRFPSNFCSSNLSVPVTVTAVDFCGNSNSETFNVAIERPTTFFAPNDTILPCGSAFGPDITGYPMLDTDNDGVGDLPIQNNTCDFASIFTDQEVSSNSSSTLKIFRTWQVSDGCNRSTPVTLPTQVIEVKDTGRPGINCPAGSQRGTTANPYVISTGSTGCTATLNIPTPGASTDCSGSQFTVEFLKIVSLHDSTEFTNRNTQLEIGEYFAEYFARDNSGNRSDTCQIFFDVIDSGAPVAICVSGLNVAFVNGQTRLTVDDIDAGSGDNCQTLEREIRKDGGDWGQEVIITCDEVNNGARIFLRVTAENGATNTCWTTITGKDNSVPDCDNLEDQTIACDNFQVDNFGTSTDSNNNSDFDENEWATLTGSLLSRYNSAFGDPNCGSSSACSAEAILEQQYQLVAAQCGETRIIRRFRAVGEESQSEWKEQNITLTFEEDFVVTFPADWEGECGDDFPEANLDLSAQGCNILAWTFEDQQFEGPSGTCLFIERTYIVTNWCVAEVGQQPLRLDRVEDGRGFSSEGLTITDEEVSNVGIFEYVQVLRVSDNTAPTIQVADVIECITENECSTQRTFSISADDCLGAQGLTYSFELSQNGTILQSGNTSNFSATVVPGDYQVTWSVGDNCGNTATTNASYTFVDCNRPTPFCNGGATLTLNSETQNVTVWASDLNQKSEDNCSSEENLELRVWHTSLEGTVTRPVQGDAGSVALGLPQNIELNCDYLGNQNIELYVIDEAGNWDFCLTSVFIQDASGVCGTGLIDPNIVSRVSGGIFTRGNIPLGNVTISARGTALFEHQFTTDESGIFEFDLPRGIGYAISLDKEDMARNGLSVFDIIMVTKHILNETPLSSPYDFIAADVNQSGSVSTFDVVVMRRIILGLEDAFPNNKSWRFINASYRFGSENPAGEDFEETLLIDDFQNDLTELDFVAVKLGDLNNSAMINGLYQAEERENSKLLQLDIQDGYFKKGEQVTVDIHVRDLANLTGLQYTLDFHNLRLVNVDKTLVPPTHYRSNDYNFAICWDAYSGKLFESNASSVARLTLEVAADGYLSEFISLSKDADNEAVNENLEQLKVALNFEKPIETPSFELFQNTPNPFSDETVIGFYLDEAQAITLDVYATNGVRLHQMKGVFGAGYHNITLRNEDLSSSGILFYQLNTREGNQIKKMIIAN